MGDTATATVGITTAPVGEDGPYNWKNADGSRRGDGFFEKPGNGETNDWITPKYIIDALGPFDLDPCSSRTQPWKCAAENITEDEDGFNREWHGNVWLNPPYGSDAARWVQKLADHGTGISLIFARTETRLWQDFVFKYGDAFLFVEKRIAFCRPDGTPGGNGRAPSVIIAFGEENVKRLLKVVEDGSIPGYVLGKITRI